jgi:hypothetical protein
MDKDLFYNRDDMYSNRLNIENKLAKDLEKFEEQLSDLVTVNIRDMGAKKSTEPGGDAVDNIQKITNAIAYVADTYGKGIVWIPEGEFLISPTKTKRIVLRSNVTIKGVGTLKVKDDAGDYETIFGAQTNGTYVENVKFEGFTVDQNPKKNTTCKITIGIANTSQFVISLQNFKNAKVRNMTFNYCSGVNTVLLSGRGCRIAIVKDCEFRFAKPINHASYDNSAIYFNCEHHQASGNMFYADLAESAGGAIETHNGLSTITNNTSDGYSTVCNVVSASSGEPKTRDYSDIVVANNVATKCRYGIRLWSITNMELTNVIIANNVLSVNNADRGLALVGGINMVRDSNLEGGYKNIKIVNNTITFQRDTTQRADIVDSSMFAIGLAVKAKLSNIIVKGNTIENAPVRAIKLGFADAASSVTNAIISDNTIINAGIYTFVNQYYRAAIQIEGILNHVTVERNDISDNNDVFGGFMSLDANSGTFTDVSIKHNRVYAKQGGFYYRVNKTLGVDEGDAVKKHYAATFPLTNKLQLKAGDIVINTGTLTPGTSYTGYRVTTAGTSGTLTRAITGSCTVNSNIVTVSDASELRVGDQILIAGSGKAPAILQITGNTLLMASTYTVAVTDGAITYYAPVLKGYGQLQA